jgi:6-phosphogluconolactonase (cycloisomerase 2 family)
MYLFHEEASTLALFDWDSERGTLTFRETHSGLPSGFAGTNFASEVRISPNGKFLYAANRLHDSIAEFAIEADGTLAPMDHVWTRGDYPCSFTIDPTGRFLYSCNQNGDSVTCFRIDEYMGKLEFTGQYVPVPAPSMMLFLE